MKVMLASLEILLLAVLWRLEKTVRDIATAKNSLVLKVERISKWQKPGGSIKLPETRR